MNSSCATLSFALLHLRFTIAVWPLHISEWPLTIAICCLIFRYCHLPNTIVIWLLIFHICHLPIDICSLTFALWHLHIDYWDLPIDILPENDFSLPFELSILTFGSCLKMIASWQLPFDRWSLPFNRWHLPFDICPSPKCDIPLLFPHCHLTFTYWHLPTTIVIWPVIFNHCHLSIAIYPLTFTFGYCVTNSDSLLENCWKFDRKLTCEYRLEMWPKFYTIDVWRSWNRISLQFSHPRQISSQ